ncbi:PREDICTED: uncharacterized protein LOC108560908 [Nicrophorus vespilloides]|uniref:Uncharacterized protein LOC108560908 n=1 Tax=Nicrophorus vespilloides TaxID=110193 RepID=A0ABM1MHR8_NICVS|nr:PREDICTED: uncharacterized protein LOC108560908 [Nicrophorus vespilloides]
MDQSYAFSEKSSDLIDARVTTTNLFWLLRFCINDIFCYRILGITSNLNDAKSIKKGDMVKINENNVVVLGRVVAASANLNVLLKNKDALIQRDLRNYEVNLKIAEKCCRGESKINQMRNILSSFFNRITEKVLKTFEKDLFIFGPYKIVLKILNYQSKNKFLVMIVFNKRIIVTHCFCMKRRKENATNIRNSFSRDVRVVRDFLNIAIRRCKITVLNSLRILYKTNCTEQYRITVKRNEK